MNDLSNIDTDTGAPYAPPALEAARGHIGRLVDAFREATGFSTSFVAAFARKGDTKWLTNYLHQNITMGTYDQVVSRLSAVWPDDVAWPDGVPRQAPSTEADEWMTQMRERLAARQPKEPMNG